MRPKATRDRPAVRPPTPAEVGPEFPEILDYLWDWFQEISLGLAPNGFAPPVITWEGLRAWQELTRVGTLDPWEVRALVTLGMLRASIIAEKSKTEQSPTPQSQPSLSPPAARPAITPPMRRLR